jgi:hypothetical protein
MGDRKRQDPLLDHRRQLVGHLRGAPLARAQDLGPVALDATLPGVIGRAVDSEGPTGLRHRGPAGEVEELQAVAEQPVIIGHAAHFLSPLLGGEGGRVCRAADATQPAGWGRGNLVVDAAANGADCWSNGAEPATTTLSEAV